jgi:hypothetical protein
MSSANGKKSLALLAAGVLGSTAVTASAAPFMTVSLVGRINGSADAFSNSVVVGPGDIVQYEVRVQLGQEGAINPNAGAANTQTITNWVPSQGATSPTSGLNNVRFNLGQNPAPGEMLVDFDAPSAIAPGWEVGSGATGGALAPRGDGNDNLASVFYNRATGNFDGIGPGDVPVLMTLGTGVFDVAAGGNPTVVSANSSGFSNTVLLAGLRWRNAANAGNVGYNPSALQQNNSTAGGDPIIVYQGLNLVPEPATVGLLGLAGVGMLARRRRQA